MPKISEAGQQQVQSALDGATKNTGVPGLAFVAIDKNGELLAQQHAGNLGPQSSKPVNEDSVFWIASCTKMIAGIACMQLVEQGQLDLDSSKQLYELLPEVKAKDQVLVADGQWEPRKHDITLRQCLTHTAGFGYDIFNEKIRNYGRPTGFNVFDGDFKDVRDIPLVNQPGSRWEYSVGIDWAGICVERVTGLQLNDYFQRNIFEPLGIKDLSMFPNKHMRENLVSCVQRFPDGSTAEIDHPFRRAIYMADQPEQRIKIHNAAGHGCFAKPKEYAKIIATLLNNGTSPTTGKQILKKETVDEMFKNQIPNLPRYSYEYIKSAKPQESNDLPVLYPQPDNPDQGWGITFLIRGNRPGPTGSGPNTVNWAGITNLFWWADREKGVGGMIAGQVLPFADPTIMGAWVQAESAVYENLPGQSEALPVR